MTDPKCWYIPSRSCREQITLSKRIAELEAENSDYRDIEQAANQRIAEFEIAARSLLNAIESVAKTLYSLPDVGGEDKP
jgi:hypothetical protein